MTSRLRAWYAARRDAYPWRGTRDPYRVLVSEFMLQQTQAARVVPAYRAFVRRFPTDVDTNLRRVVARVRLGRDASEGEEIDGVARRWIDRTDPGAWNQALMDVGREHCRPAPMCEGCPLARGCSFRRHGGALTPVRRRQPAFEGSSRQLRGAIVRHLRTGPSTLRSLARATGDSEARIGRMLETLVRDGLVRAGPAALSGHPGARARLR